MEDVGRINLKIARNSDADSLGAADMDMDTPIVRQAYNLLSPPPATNHQHHPPPTFGGLEYFYKALEALPSRCYCAAAALPAGAAI